ncbi:hypothetical protein F2Q70_00026166 [Brassica cretica]|uniref:Uncharacterized protein n=1 Tax=Brassica cretica TaxID=69181 RepID=A0A8S9L273_BRACR|nr:hypothetical protein F2Q68_00025722 [Brassica cretica]KAF2601424.1 hypothetical protein F2Q70_00026166 [Brassica cretica]
MVSPIETKQASVRSDHRRGSYENGMKAACSVQLAKWASWTACPVQLAKWTSWTASVGPTRQKGKLDGLLGPTCQMDELDGLLGPILSFGGLDVSVSLSGIRCLRPRATFLKDLSSGSLSDLLRNLT